jgi:hypothetical protein
LGFLVFMSRQDCGFGFGGFNGGGGFDGGEAFEFDDVVEGDEEVTGADESVFESKVQVLWAVEGGGDTGGVRGVEDTTEEDGALQREHLVAFGRMTGKSASMNSREMAWVCL